MLRKNAKITTNLYDVDITIETNCNEIQLQLVGGFAPFLVSSANWLAEFQRLYCLIDSFFLRPTQPDAVVGTDTYVAHNHSQKLILGGAPDDFITQPIKIDFSNESANMRNYRVLVVKKEY